MSRSLVPVLTPHGSLRLDGLDDEFVLERALADRLEKSFGRGLAMAFCNSARGHRQREFRGRHLHAADDLALLRQ